MKEFQEDFAQIDPSFTLKVMFKRLREHHDASFRRVKANKDLIRIQAYLDEQPYLREALRRTGK